MRSCRVNAMTPSIQTGSGNTLATARHGCRRSPNETNHPTAADMSSPIGKNQTVPTEMMGNHNEIARLASTS